MMKKCVVLNGAVINIGEWDFQVTKVEVGLSESGEPIYEEHVMNPLPDGSEVLELEVAQNEDGGWYAVEYQPVKTPSETDLIGQQLTQVKLQAIQQQQMISSLGAELAAAKLEIINLKGADPS